MTIHLFRRWLLGLLLLSSVSLSAQTNRIKVMSWNILNWPSTSAIASDTSERCPAYRAVINHTKPDILMTCENNGIAGVPWFRDQVMIAATGYSYRYGTFINGYDSDNAIYYRDSLFQFVSNVPITTSLRDINQYTLVYKPTSDTLVLFMCHLKAGTGFETDRELEVANLRAVTNTFPPGRNFLIGGDFNVYASTEPAYQNLLQVTGANDGNFNDVITGMTGVWNSFVYADYHTQSTRTVIGPGGGSTGGLDDRFDMILFSNALLQTGGVSYVPGTYTAVGNDGNHYNDSISMPVNSAVPAQVAAALQTASDHLPVMVTLQMSTLSALNTPSDFSDLFVFPNPVSQVMACEFNSARSGNLEFSLRDLSGREVWKEFTQVDGKGYQKAVFQGFDAIQTGIYLLSIKSDNNLIVRKISICH